jgi:beta-lactamase superfamily II metal-dependent hydrolase
LGKSALKRGNRVFITVAVVAVIAVIAVGTAINRFGWDRIFQFFGLRDTPAVSRAVDGIVQVHIIDVGQGDCSLILTKENSVLIDCGEAEYADSVIAYMRQLGVKKLDFVIASHMHSDHMGGMDKIIAAMTPDRLIMPELPDSLVPTTATFERLIDAVEKYQVEPVYAKAGDIIELDQAVFEILSPHPDYEFDNLNDSSIVAKLVHGDNSFLFTGDIEKSAENDILKRKVDVSADVLKVAHHGSKTSSQKKFLKEVGGDYAVICVGSPNSYNHPNDKTVERLGELKYTIVRTDKLGTIVFESSRDGLSLVSKKSGGE